MQPGVGAELSILWLVKAGKKRIALTVKPFLRARIIVFELEWCCQHLGSEKPP